MSFVKLLSQIGNWRSRRLRIRAKLQGYVLQSTKSQPGSLPSMMEITGWHLGSGFELLLPCHATYRVTHLLANLGWVDFDFGCFAILPTCSASSANFPSAKAEPGRVLNIQNQNQSQPNPGSPGDVSPCRLRDKEVRVQSHFPNDVNWQRSERTALGGQSPLIR